MNERMNPFRRGRLLPAFKVEEEGRRASKAADRPRADPAAMRPPRSPGAEPAAIVGTRGSRDRAQTPHPRAHPPTTPGPGPHPQPTARGATPATASGSSAAAAAAGRGLNKPTVSRSAPRRRRPRPGLRAQAQAAPPQPLAQAHCPTPSGRTLSRQKVSLPGPAAAGSDPEKATETPSPQAVGSRSSTCARGHSWSPRERFPGLTGKGAASPERACARTAAEDQGRAGRGRREPPFPRGPEDRVRGGGRRSPSREEPGADAAGSG